jgi:hypothetical protein
VGAGASRNAHRGHELLESSRAVNSAIGKKAGREFREIGSRERERERGAHPNPPSWFDGLEIRSLWRRRRRRRGPGGWWDGGAGGSSRVSATAAAREERKLLEGNAKGWVESRFAALSCQNRVRGFLLLDAGDPLHLQLRCLI